VAGIELLQYALTPAGLDIGGEGRVRRFVIAGEAMTGACHVAWPARDLENDERVVLKAHHGMQPRATHPTKDVYADVVASLLSRQVFNGIADNVRGAPHSVKVVSGAFHTFLSHAACVPDGPDIYVVPVTILRAFDETKLAFEWGGKKHTWRGRDLTIEPLLGDFTHFYDLFGQRLAEGGDAEFEVGFHNPSFLVG